MNTDLFILKPYLFRYELDSLNDAHRRECEAYHECKDAWIHEYNDERSKELHKKLKYHSAIADALCYVIDNCKIIE